jgi:hypothetical protein
LVLMVLAFIDSRVKQAQDILLMKKNLLIL